MQKTPSVLIEECQLLRRQGYSLDEIVRVTGVPRTTVYGYIAHIRLSLERQSAIKIAATKRINEFNITFRKGKCIPGRVVPKPEGWNDELLFVTSHLMFDGEIASHGCVYNNRSVSLIQRFQDSMKEVFQLIPMRVIKNEKTGVYRVSYHYVELADYVREKAGVLKKYIKTASLREKRVFLQAFFDDEGCVTCAKRGKRIVRGFQHNTEILELVQKLLKDFGIASRVDEKYQEIVISRKENLAKFRDEVNFSKGVYINPERTNSIWKKKLEKRKLLDIAINSFER